MKPYVIAMTGASGVIYGVRLTQVLLESGYDVDLVISDAARLVLREEMEIKLKSLTDAGSIRQSLHLEGKGKLQCYSSKDFTAPIASGSYPIHSMTIIPCSMGTLGAIASGVSNRFKLRAIEGLLSPIQLSCPFSISWIVDSGS